MRLAKLPIINKPWRDGWFDASGEKRTLKINHYKCAHGMKPNVCSLFLSISNAFIADNTYLSTRFIACNDLIFSRVVIITNFGHNHFPRIFPLLHTLCEPNACTWQMSERTLRMNVYFPFDSVITQLKCIEMITRHFQRNVHSMRILSESLLWILINSIRSHTCALHELQLTLFTQRRQFNINVDVLAEFVRIRRLKWKIHIIMFVVFSAAISLALSMSHWLQC